VKRREEQNISSYFRGENWRVHPEWVYCDHPSKQQAGAVPLSAEEAIIQFLSKVDANGGGHNLFRWRTTSIRPPVYDRLTCEKDLVQSLVFDAKATDINSSSKGGSCGGSPRSPAKYDPLGLLLALLSRDRIVSMYGVYCTFLATRSGLTRFEDHRTPEEKANATDRPFWETGGTRATDEMFYKRAVEFHRINSSAFVFSVPFDAGTKPPSSVLVTGSHAVFVGSGKQRAPVAVVGLQLRHAAFAERFFNVTSKCSSPVAKCNFKCSDEDLDCYLLDNNGFVVVSETHEHTGKHLGDVDNTLLQAFVAQGIYRRVRMFDMQAVCLDVLVPSGPSSLLVPFENLRLGLLWLWTKIFLFFTELGLSAASDYAYEGEPEYEDDRALPNKTRPRPCDKE